MSLARPDEFTVELSDSSGWTTPGRDPSTGKTLWHVNAGGRMVSSPMTYELDGKQYLLTAVQDVVFVWTLP